MESGRLTKPGILGTERMVGVGALGDMIHWVKFVCTFEFLILQFSFILKAEGLLLLQALKWKQRKLQ